MRVEGGCSSEGVLLESAMSGVCAPLLTSNLCVQIGCPLAWYIESDNSRQMDAYELIYVD